MELKFAKPKPMDFAWVGELETAIAQTTPTAADTGALQAACAQIRAAVRELEKAMQDTHDACHKMNATLGTAKPGGPAPGPIPVPYPNIQMGKADLKSKVVKVERATQTKAMAQQKLEQVVNQQMFKLSRGDEPVRRGVVSSMNKGKTQFQRWSMDVKAEGKSVVRFADMATRNHM